MAKTKTVRLTKKDRLALGQGLPIPGTLENAVEKRRILAQESLPIGDDRVTSGSVSELHGMLGELTAILCGAAALVEGDEHNQSRVENPISAAAELLQLALCRCEQLDDLIGPESVASSA